MSDERNIRVYLTSDNQGNAAVRVKESEGAWGVWSEREIWFGTYEELANILELRAR